MGPQSPWGCQAGQIDAAARNSNTSKTCKTDVGQGLAGQEKIDPRSAPRNSWTQSHAKPGHMARSMSERHGARGFAIPIIARRSFEKSDMPVVVALNIFCVAPASVSTCYNSRERLNSFLTSSSSIHDFQPRASPNLFDPSRWFESNKSTLGRYHHMPRS